MICPQDVPDTVFEKEIRFFDLVPKKFRIQDGLVHKEQALQEENPEPLSSDDPVNDRFEALKNQMSRRRSS